LRLDEEQLHAALAGVESKHASRDDLRVVDDDTISRTEKIGQLAKHVILEGAASPVDHEEARRVALGGGCLSDGVAGQLIIELVKLHDP